MIHHLLDNTSRARKRKTTAILLSIVFIIVIFSVANPSTSRFWPKCLFKLITGYDCPICGLQRSLYAFLHGDFSHAIAYNYYLILALPYACLCLVFTLLPQGKTKKEGEEYYYKQTCFMVLRYHILCMAHHQKYLSSLTMKQRRLFIQ